MVSQCRPSLPPSVAPLRCVQALAFGVALLTTSLAWSQSGSAGDKASIEATYQKDKAACMTREAAQERSNCLREAGAVRAEALRGAEQGGESQETLTRNAMERCKRQPAEQRAICERMVRGEGSTSGSVEGGGMIRELTIMEPVKPAASQAPKPADATPPPASGGTPPAPLPNR